jgi:hypothetical protein
MLSLPKFNQNIKNIPNIYNLKNLETAYEEMLICIKIINKKVISIKFNDINLKFDEIETNYNGYVDIPSILYENGIYDIQKYNVLDYSELKAQFFTNENKQITYYIQDEETRRHSYINNNTILDEMYINELLIYTRYNLKSYKQFNDFNEEYLNIKLSVKSDFISHGNMYIKCGEYYGVKDSKFTFYKVSKDKEFGPSFIHLFLTITKVKKVCEVMTELNKREFSEMIDNTYSDSEQFLKKIMLPLYINNNKSNRGDIVCELFKFNDILYLYFTKIILPNNEIFNIHKECKICNQYKNNSNKKNKFNVYNSTCEHVLIDLINFFETNFKNNTDIPIQIIISDLIDEIKEYDNYKEYIIRTYGKSVFFSEFE